MSKTFAISSTGKTEKSLLDLRFGKCIFICLYDQDSGTVTFLENPYKDEENSGINMVNLLATKGISTVITGEVGPKAMDMLKKKKIQLVLLHEERIKIEEIIKRIKS